MIEQIQQQLIIVRGELEKLDLNSGDLDVALEAMALVIAYVSEAIATTEIEFDLAAFTDTKGVRWSYFTLMLDILEPLFLRTVTAYEEDSVQGRYLLCVAISNEARNLYNKLSDNKIKVSVVEV